MASGDVVFERNERMRRVSEVVQQNLDSGIWKRFSDEAHEPHVVLEVLVCVVCDFLSVVLLKELRVNFLFRGFELRAHITLFANENELSGGRIIFVLQEVMHPQPEIFKAEFAKVFARDRERVEIVLFKISAKLPSPFLVLSP